MRTRGFTLIELLVVIAVIGVLAALLLPAVQAAREAAKRTACRNNLVQLITAVHNYENARGAYPPGTLNPNGPIVNAQQGYHHNWVVETLPYLEQIHSYRRIDRSVGVYHKNNAPLRGLSLGTLLCPTMWSGVNPYSNYAAVHHNDEAPIDVDNNGVFFLNSKVRYDDVTDGSSNTIFIGEKVPISGDLGWMSGTNATLRNTGVGLNVTGFGPGGSPIVQLPHTGEWSAGGPPPQATVGGFGSWHPGSVNFAFGDGRVSGLSAAVGMPLLQKLAHRADGRLLDPGEFQ